MVPDMLEFMRPWSQLGPLRLNDVHKSICPDHPQVSNLGFSSMPKFIRGCIVPVNSRWQPVPQIHCSSSELGPKFLWYTCCVHHSMQSLKQCTVKPLCYTILLGHIHHC